MAAAELCQFEDDLGRHYEVADDDSKSALRPGAEPFRPQIPIGAEVVTFGSFEALQTMILHNSARDAVKAGIVCGPAFKHIRGEDTLLAFIVEPASAVAPKPSSEWKPTKAAIATEAPSSKSEWQVASGRKARKAPCRVASNVSALILYPDADTTEEAKPQPTASQALRPAPLAPAPALTNSSHGATSGVGPWPASTAVLRAYNGCDGGVDVWRPMLAVVGVIMGMLFGQLTSKLANHRKTARPYTKALLVGLLVCLVAFDGPILQVAAHTLHGSGDRHAGRAARMAQPSDLAAGNQIQPHATTDDPGSTFYIDNANLWRTREGERLKVADGGLHFYEGRWWLYGATYCQCDPASHNASHWTCPVCAWYFTRFAAYSSADLSPTSWVLESEDIFPDRGHFPASNTTYFEPDVIFNANTGMYVLWFTVNVVPSHHSVASATSMSPQGPFVAVAEQWEHRALALPYTSDCYTWVSDDSTKAYLQLNLRDVPYGLYVVELDETFTLTTDSTSEVAGRPGEFLEGGGVFNHGADWFILGGKNTCMGSHGTETQAWRATSPLGPYTYAGEVVKYAPPNGSVTRAQQFGVTRIGSQLLYQGVRWFHDLDAPSFCTANPPVWLPLSFGSDGSLQQVQWADGVTVSLE